MFPCGIKIITRFIKRQLLGSYHISLKLWIVLHKLLCYNLHINKKEAEMATNLALDDKILIMAQSIAGIKTKRETVNLALKEFVQRRKQEEIIDLFGQIEYERDYDYKKMRKGK